MHVCDELEPPSPAAAQASHSVAGDWTERFDRIMRLYGAPSLNSFARAKVIIFGLGGVGSFAAEALARSAIGHLMLVDFDTVAVSNTNRQLQALTATWGQPKAAVLAERLRRINPLAAVEVAVARYRADNSAALLAPPAAWSAGAANDPYDFVVDAIDDVPAKAHLLASCRARGLSVVSSMGAAGKMDPTRIRVGDLGATQVCPLARHLRRQLRLQHGLPAAGPMGLTAVYSDEPRATPPPSAPPFVPGALSAEVAAPPDAPAASPAPRGRPINATSVAVTGAFGLTCASYVINTLSRRANSVRSKSSAL